MKPAAVTSVPVSIGKAVEVQAKDAGALAVPALLELHDDHLDRDDRVVDQQAERDDERAERHALQVEAQERHRDEHDREHQRDRGRDDDAGAPAERNETHREHDRQRFDEASA